MPKRMNSVVGCVCSLTLSMFLLVRSSNYAVPTLILQLKSASDSIFLDVHPKNLQGFLTHQSNWGCSTSLAGVLHVANTCCCSTHVPDVSSPSTTNISPFRLRNRVKQVAVEMKNGSQVEIRNFESLGSRDAIFIEKRF